MWVCVRACKGRDSLLQFTYDDHSLSYCARETDISSALIHFFLGVLERDLVALEPAGGEEGLVGSAAGAAAGEVVLVLGLEAAGDLARLGEASALGFEGLLTDFFPDDLR